MSDKTLQIRVILSALDGITRPFRGVGRESKKLKTEIAATRGELRQLNQAARNLGGLRKAETDIVSTNIALGQAKKRLDQLRAAYQAADAPTKKLTREFNQAGHAVANLEARHKDQVAALKRLQGELADAGVDVKNLGAAEQTLKRRIDETNGALDRQRQKLERVDQAAARAQRIRNANQGVQKFAGKAAVAGAAMTAAGAASGAPLLQFADEARSLQSLVTDIRQKSGLGRGAAAGIQKQIVDSGQAANLLPEEFARVIDGLTGAGQDLASAMKDGSAAARAATAWRISAEDTAATTFTAQEKFGADGGQALDVLGYLGKKGRFEQGDMARKFDGLAASYAPWGQKGIEGVADIGAGAQVVRMDAGSSDEAATNFDNLLNKLGSPETEKKFKKFGVDFRKAMLDAKKNGVSPLEAAIAASEKATGGDDTKLGYLVEDIQAKKALAALIRHKDVYRDLKREALSAKGVVDADFADRMQDDDAKLKALQIELAQMKLEAAKPILEALREAAPMLTAVVRGVTGFVKRHPDLVKMAGMFALIASVCGVVALGIGGIAAAIAFIGVPAALIIGTLAAFFAALPVWLKQQQAKWMAFVGFLRTLWTILKSVVDGGLASMLSAFARFSPLGPFTAALQPLFRWLEGLTEKFRGFGLQAIGGFIQGLLRRKEEVSAASAEAAGAAEHGAKNRLQIKSPSRVFARLGDHTMAGLALGILRSREGPLAQARAVAGGLAGAASVAGGLAGPGLAVSAPARVGAAPAAAAAAPAGDRYEVHFHPSPGMDERQLFGMFETWMARRDRERASRGRSAFADYDED